MFQLLSSSLPLPLGSRGVSKQSIGSGQLSRLTRKPLTSCMLSTPSAFQCRSAYLWYSSKTVLLLLLVLRYCTRTAGYAATALGSKECLYYLVTSCLTRHASIFNNPSLTTRNVSGRTDRRGGQVSLLTCHVRSV